MNEHQITKNDEIPESVLKSFKSHYGFDHIAIDIEANNPVASDWKSVKTPPKQISEPFEGEIQFFGEDPFTTTLVEVESYVIRYVERAGDAIVMQASYNTYEIMAGDLSLVGSIVV